MTFRSPHLRTPIAPAFLAILAIAIAAPSGARAQELLGAHQDWRAFADDGNDGRVCYMVTEPVDMEPKNVRRGDVYLMVTHRPGENVRNEVSIITGYTYEKDSAVTVQIGDRKFELFTSGDGAWLRDAAEDEAIVQEMRRGLSAVATGRSSRGTTTVDRYSLRGFTAAHNAIGRRCR